MSRGRGLFLTDADIEGDAIGEKRYMRAEGVKLCGLLHEEFAVRPASEQDSVRRLETIDGHTKDERVGSKEETKGRERSGSPMRDMNPFKK